MGSDGSPAQCVVDVGVTYKTADKAGPFISALAEKYWDAAWPWGGK